MANATRRSALAMTGASLAVSLSTFAASAALPQPCALSRAVEAYRRGEAELAAAPFDQADDMADALVEAFGRDVPPVAGGLMGVAEAIRYAFEVDAFLDHSAEPPLRAALAYLDARIARGEG